jgi:hypothetical protein
MESELKEPDNPEAFALAKLLKEYSLSTLMAAFRYMDMQLSVDTVEAPYPPESDFSVETFDGELWIPFRFKVPTIDKAREIRDSFGKQAPDRRFRIIRWDEMPTVVETD